MILIFNYWIFTGESNFYFILLSYEFVEKPFRNKNKIDNKTFLITNLSLTLICLAISIFILKKWF